MYVQLREIHILHLELSGFRCETVSGEYFRIAGDGTTVYEVVYTRLKYKLITN